MLIKLSLHIMMLKQNKLLSHIFYISLTLSSFEKWGSNGAISVLPVATEEKRRAPRSSDPTTALFKNRERNRSSGKARRSLTEQVCLSGLHGAVSTTKAGEVDLMEIQTLGMS